MKKANIEIKEKTVFSKDFDDIYFDAKAGIEESEFVYINALDFDKESYVVAELGFGIGLNFFLSLEKFKQQNKCKRLFYLSLEAFYIGADELLKIYKRLGFYDRFKDDLTYFLKFYPKCKEGIYRFYFKNCFLDLVFGDATKSIKELDFRADVWFLDGFNPKKNQELFDEYMINHIARLSKEGAKLHSFSASSFLQKNLKKCNFEIHKTKGFNKREMIQARLKSCPDVTDTKAYFARLYTQKQGKKIAIIGSGIAAVSLAYELCLRDFEVELFEKNESLASGASGNDSGILSSLILKKGVALGEFSTFAFYEASRFYRQILDLKMHGVFEFAHNELMQERFNSQKSNPLFKIKDNVAFLEDASHIKARQICESLYEKSKAKLNLKHHFIGFKKDKNGFTLNFKEQDLRSGFDILIYAMGADSADFVQYDFLKLSKVRGQISLMKPFLDTKHALSSKGYICPINGDIQIIGASYDRMNSNPQALKSDDEANIENIKEFLKKDESLEVLASRVSFRSYSSDRFMIAGAFYDEEYYKNAYKKLFWNKNKAQQMPKNIENMYLSTAHGSRAFASAIIAARYISALINNEPLAVKKEFIEHFHPARFLIRKLKKGLA